MAAEPTDALDVGLRIAAALEARGVPHALGGALAYGLWGIPRATVDVDVNAFVPPDQISDVCAALQDVGISVDFAAARGASAHAGLFIVECDGYRVDVFTASIDFSWEALRTRVQRTVRGQLAWFLSAEAIAVFKMLFFRGKDVVDLERLIAVQGANLDVARVRAHLVDMMGDADERVRRWDELVAQHMPA